MQRDHSQALNPNRSELVSVVIPCRDCERYLGAAIESVLEQTWPSHEVIVVDDGSTDRSVEVARGFGDAIRLLSQRTAGAGAARNAGLELARGRFFAFLDADDLWPPDSLAARMQAFARDPGSELVAGMAVHFMSPDLDPSSRRLVRLPEGPSFARLPGTMVIRREPFERVGGFPTGLVAGEAMDWVMRADEAGVRSSAVDRVVLRRRLHLGNIGRTSPCRQSDYLRVVKAALDRRRAGPDAGGATEPER